jgi:hypothetical protein
MSQQLEKTLHNAFLTLGAFLLAAVVGVGIHAVRTGSWIDYAPKEWLSDDDKKALKDPAAANKEAYDKMAREAWQNTPKTYNPQNDPWRQTNWNQGWKK